MMVRPSLHRWVEIVREKHQSGGSPSRAHFTLQFESARRRWV